MSAEQGQLTDAKLALAWDEFKANYETLGYRKASYELFVLYLQQQGLAEVPSSDEIQRRLNSFRKRQRSTHRRLGESDST